MTDKEIVETMKDYHDSLVDKQRATLKARTSNETVELLRECRPHIARIAGMEQAGGYPLIATSTLHRIDAHLSNITDQGSDQHD